MTPVYDRLDPEIRDFIGRVTFTVVIIALVGQAVNEALRR